MTEPRDESEAALLAACRDGDPAARRRLFEQAAPRVHAIASHFFGRDPATAADVTQEVLVKAMSSLGRFRGDSRFTTWLHRITVNACLDERRRAARLVALEEREAPAPPSADEAALVREAVTRLPESLRIAVVLRHFEELSYAEMALALGCSEGTIASRLSRGHAQLARELRALRGGRQ